VEIDVEQRPIVVGVHGSAASLAALRWAAREATLRHVTLHVVRAWEDQGRHLAPYARLRLPGSRQSRAAASVSLEQAVRVVANESPLVTMTAEVADGRPARVLIDRAAHAGLLVLGSAARDVLGPVARVCLHRARCPVVLITVHGADVLVPA
jgi:nucleotide-binding universal stress UspA family protein